MFIKRNYQCVEFEEDLDAVIGKQGGKCCYHNAQGVDDGWEGAWCRQAESGSHVCI